MNKKERKYTDLFEELIRNKGWTYRQSSKREDMHDHIDGHVTVCYKGKACNSFTVDLKGTKYTSRANEGNPDCMCQYIEFMTVRGDKGWLFGKSEYIAILDECEKRFYLILRTDMIKFCEDLFNVNLRKKFISLVEDLAYLDCWVKSATEAYHKLYRRRGRSDIVTQISMDDVKALAKIII